MSNAAFPDNTASDLPHDLQGWNWGAFGLSWIWGIANRTYVSLFVFVPVIGWFVMPFVLGAKGNALAWRNRRWDSAEQFLRTQRLWARYALIAYGCVALVAVVVFYGVSLTLQSSEAFALATAKLEKDPRVRAAIGQPLEAGMPSGSIELVGGSGTTSLAFSVSGPKGAGTAHATAEQQLGRWVLQQMELELAGGERIVLHEASAASERGAAALATGNSPAAQPERAPHNTALQVIAESTEIQGRLPRQRVEQLIEQHRNELRQCFAAQQALSERTTLEFTVLSTGAVTDAIVNPAGQPVRLALCLTDAVTRWTFPAPKGGSTARVRHTFSVTTH